jgi:hypothetical protein
MASKSETSISGTTPRGIAQYRWRGSINSCWAFAPRIVTKKLVTHRGARRHDDASGMIWWA